MTKTNNCRFLITMSTSQYDTIGVFSVSAMQCGEKAHYESNFQGTERTCKNPDVVPEVKPTCEGDLNERCVCDAGHVRSHNGHDCVLPEQCGCQHEGRIYQVSDYISSTASYINNGKRIPSYNCLSEFTNILLAISRQLVWPCQAILPGWFQCLIFQR